MRTPQEELKEMFKHRSPADVAIEINGFTAWRTTLIDELTNSEAEKLIDIHRPKAKLAKENNALREELIRKEWMSFILSNAEKAGVKKPDGFCEFNNWMLTRSIYKKHLNAHTIEELRDLNRQLNALKNNNAKSANRAMTKAWWEKAESLKHMN